MKTDSEIENLLSEGRNIAFSQEDKASVKAELLSMARESLAKEAKSIPSPYTAWLLKSAATFASLLFVFVGTAYASKDSLPGEPLYAMKVGVFEEMVSFTKFGTEDQVLYELELMEERLKELQFVSKNPDSLASEDVVGFVDQISEHIDDISSEVAVISEEVSHQDRVDTLSKLSGITKAQAKLIKESEVLEGGETYISDVEEAAFENLKDAVGDFTSTAPTEDVNQYLSEQIDQVSEVITETSVEDEVRDSAEQHLNDLDEALIDGDVAEALVSVLEAKQELELEISSVEETD